jgi:peptide/nickel transport system substrate-binding protein
MEQWETSYRLGYRPSLKATEHPALLSFSPITAPNDQTLRLTFVTIDCAAVTTLAQLPLLPAAAIEEPLPLGSGPFRVADWSDNKRTLTLTRNPYYHGPKPALEGLNIRFIAPNEVDIAVSEGQFDLIGPLTSLPTLPSPTFYRRCLPRPQAIYLAVNMIRIEQSSDVRQALLLALDREAILAETLEGDGQLLAGSLLPGHWAANPDLAWPIYDPQAARRLLAKAGLKDEDGDGWLDRAGQRLEVGIRLNGEHPLHQNLGWLASNYYRDLGLFARAEGFLLITWSMTVYPILKWPCLAGPCCRTLTSAHWSPVRMIGAGSILFLHVPG